MQSCPSLLHARPTTRPRLPASWGGTGECSLGSDAGKIIHTYHLTRFGTANNGTATPPPPDGNGTITPPTDGVTRVEHVASNGYSVAVFYSNPRVRLAWRL